MTRAEIAKKRAAKLNIEKLRLVLLFGFSPKDTDARKQERVSQLSETCRLLQLAGSERIISVPSSDRTILDQMGPRTYGFQIDSRPTTSALSDARAHIEKTYLTAGWILGISDADLIHLRVIGCTDICPRKVVDTPEAFARAFNYIPLLSAQNPQATCLVYQARNNPSNLDGVDRIERPYHDAHRAVRPNNLIFITGRTKAHGQYAPKNKHWNLCEDIFRIQSELKNGGSFGVVCIGPSWIVYDEKCGYRNQVEWNENKTIIKQLFGYTIQDNRPQHGGVYDA